MKQVAIWLAMLVVARCAMAQTALYKKYASRDDLRVYCVEHFQLTESDTVTVTFIEADDEGVCREVRSELMGLKAPHPSKKDAAIGKVAKEDADMWRDKKHLIIFMCEPLAGDVGRYYVVSPSDRPTVLVFHIYKDEQMTAVLNHLMLTEFKQ